MKENLWRVALMLLLQSRVDQTKEKIVQRVQRLHFPILCYSTSAMTCQCTGQCLKLLQAFGERFKVRKKVQQHFFARQLVKLTLVQKVWFPGPLGKDPNSDMTETKNN